MQPLEALNVLCSKSLKSLLPGIQLNSHWSISKPLYVFSDVALFSFSVAVTCILTQWIKAELIFKYSLSNRIPVKCDGLISTLLFFRNTCHIPHWHVFMCLAPLQ